MKRKTMHFGIKLAMILGILPFLPLPAISQEKAAPQSNIGIPISRIESPGPADPKELESLLDEFMGKKMEEYKIPGLVFVLVKDGKIFLTKGYGYADLEKKIPVSPENTIFRAGSVSKLFTATAAMQLYEQGRLDLKADVNEYLKLFKLKDNFPEPVTLAGLLSHSAGLRGSAIGSSTRSQSDRQPLGEFLATHLPSRFAPPGSLVNYSNHGYYLIGHLIEQASAIPFEQYVAEKILQPLGMEKSSFVSPERLLPHLAKCYEYKNGGYQVLPEEYTALTTSPAGSLIATAADMARFMIAHLQGGRYQDRRILNESTCRLMQRQQFANDPRLPGTCYGFYEYRGFNLRGILHDGDVAGFSSRLFLLPEQNLGFFVCDNTGNSRLRRELTEGLLEHYFPTAEKSAAAKALPVSEALGKRLAGRYRSVRCDLDHFDKLESVTTLLDISASGVRSWIEIEPRLFQVAKSKTRLAYREDSRGNIRYLFIDAQQMPIAYERLGWIETLTVQWLWIWTSFLALVFLAAGVVWPIARKIRTRRKPLPEPVRVVRHARRLAAIISILYIIFIIGFIFSYMRLEDQVAFGVHWVITVFLAIPVINCALTIGLAVLTVMAWAQRQGGIKGRMFLTLVTLTCIGFALFLNYWKLLGFRY